MRDTSSSEFVSVLVDVADFPMDVLEELPDSAFAAVLQDVLRPSGESCAAFTSALV